MRLELTRRSDLATRALVVLADAHGRVKAAQLAEAVGTTTGLVPQVLHPLVGRGWVDSVPGPTGGYATTVDLAAVSVLDVVEAVEGPTTDGRCVVADRTCDDRGRCALHDAWARARRQLLDELARTSLADLPPAPPTHLPEVRLPEAQPPKAHPPPEERP